MVLCSGAFDGLHAGHVAYLEAVARATGTAVRVAVAPDEYIRQAKGREPYWTQIDRAAAVRGLRWVEDVVVQDTLSVASLIIDGSERVTVFAKGMDWYGRLPPDVVEACLDTGAAILFVNTPGRHVSEARG